jgi:hypothetical protein
VGLVYNTKTNKFNASYEKLEKTDWPVDGVISVKIKKKNGKKYVVNVSNSAEDGDEWKQLAVKDGKPAQSLGDFKDEKDIKWGDYRDIAASYVKGYENNVKRNAEAKKKNVTITKNNNAIKQVLQTANTTRGGDYVAQRNALRKAISGVADAKNLENQFKEFYRDRKIQKWDTSLGTKPPYGNFDATYYGQTYKGARDNWDKAVADDNIDITERYGNSNAYYLYHYTTRGKKAGNRGNAVEVTKQADAYLEKKPTDAELQQVRDKQLGVDMDTTSDRLLKIKYIADEWEKAKDGDTYWKKLAKEKYLNPEDKDQFIALFRLSDREKDKEVALVNNINVNYGITDLEDAITEAAGEKAIVDTKKFGALAQDVLKEAIGEIKKAKGQEETLAMLRGFSGFSEVMNINDTLTNSLLGDSGIGGMLGFVPGGDKFSEGLEKGIKGITGVNNVTYNWQSWFDDTLSKRYQKNIELGLTVDEAEQQIKVEKDFAKKFVTDYLVPRFDESRSMDEFVEYIDVRQNEKNPFQTQDMLDAVQTVAELKAKGFLDEIAKEKDRYFDANFYFKPTGNKVREADYALQKERVTSDWAAAKKNPNQLIDPKNPSLGTWAQQAYRFGLSLKDKENFARLHFQIIGQGKGYDAAKDILTAGAVKDYIYGTILPALKDEALESGTVFGQFIKPEEFADDVLEGLDPNSPESWEETLKGLGLEDFTGTIDDLKTYISETLQGGSATEIRRQIKYLNEQRKEPSQAKLGITYIERPEDYKPEDLKAKTELYKVFQSAGYKGTEDEFYEKFMPDVNREDMALLTSAGKGEKFSFDFGDYSDPFKSLSSMQSFFPDQDTDTEEDSGTDTSTNIFDLSLDIDKPTTKSKAAQSLLGEFTSGFNFFK